MMYNTLSVVVDVQQSWDVNLAARAQEMADTCTGEHGMLTE